MEKSVLDVTDSVKHQKQGFTTSDVRDIEGTFVEKLRGQNIDTHFCAAGTLSMVQKFQTLRTMKDRNFFTIISILEGEIWLRTDENRPRTEKNNISLVAAP